MVIVRIKSHADRDLVMDELEKSVDHFVVDEGDVFAAYNGFGSMMQMFCDREKAVRYCRRMANACATEEE